MRRENVRRGTKLKVDRSEIKQNSQSAKNQQNISYKTSQERKITVFLQSIPHHSKFSSFTIEKERETCLKTKTERSYPEASTELLSIGYDISIIVRAFPTNLFG